MAPHPRESLLPLLLALPHGALAGVPASLKHRLPSFRTELSAFGPCIATAPDVRHAVSSVPSRVVVEAGSLSGPLLEAALPTLSRCGAVVVLLADDFGLLLRWSDRILHDDGTGLGWLASAKLWASRRLDLRVEPRPGAAAGWVSIALREGEQVEAVLSAARADGIAVRESRISYQVPSPR